MSCHHIVEFRIPLDTTDGSKCTTYVDRFYCESDFHLDIFDSIRAIMNVSKTYKNLAWRLSTARRADLPHRLLTSQDIDSAFKAARVEQNTGRRRKKVAIEVINTVRVLIIANYTRVTRHTLQAPTPKGSSAISRSSTGEQLAKNSEVPSNLSSALLPYTKEFENVKDKLRCSKHQLELGENIFCWADVSQLHVPHYPLCTRDLQEWAKYLVSGTYSSRVQCS